MCGIGEQLGHGDSDIIVTETARGLTSVSAPDLLTFARNVVGLPEMRTGHVGFVGFGATQRGDRVLLAVDTSTTVTSWRRWPPPCASAGPTSTCSSTTMARTANSPTRTSCAPACG